MRSANIFSIATAPGAFDVLGFRVNRAEGAEKAAVTSIDRHRRVAYDAEGCGNRMALILRVSRGVAEDDHLGRVADSLAERGVDGDLVALCEAELDLVDGAAGNPPVSRHAGNPGKAHVRRKHDGLKNGRDELAFCKTFDICLKIMRSGQKRTMVLQLGPSLLVGHRYHHCCFP